MQCQTVYCKRADVPVCSHLTYILHGCTVNISYVCGDVTTGRTPAECVRVGIVCLPYPINNKRVVRAETASQLTSQSRLNICLVASWRGASTSVLPLVLDEHSTRSNMQINTRCEGNEMQFMWKVVSVFFPFQWIIPNVRWHFTGLNIFQIDLLLSIGVGK